MCEAALTSLPDDAGESFSNVVMDDIVDGLAWESRVFYYPSDVMTVSNDSAMNRSELCVAGQCHIRAGKPFGFPHKRKIKIKPGCEDCKRAKRVRQSVALANVTNPHSELGKLSFYH
ncbi:MAG: hypothetical protein JWQ21_4012 [Herminiimonas sp.]|nr:hypothetical protein [Herminiimonas sp.]